MRRSRLAICLASCLLLGSLCGPLPARANDRWLVWTAAPTQIGYVASATIDFEGRDPAVEGQDYIIARCEAGKPVVHITLWIDRADLPGQAINRDFMTTRYQHRSAAAVIDGREHPVPRATLTPVETGGQELDFDIPLTAPIIDAMRNGESMAIRIDQFMMPPVALRGAAGALDSFREHCKASRQ